jgi:hypothetical protein
MNGFTAGHAVRQIADAIGRRSRGIQSRRPLARRAGALCGQEKHPLQLGTLPDETELIEGDFWQDEIARHGRRRLSTAVWLALGNGCLESKK